MIQKRLGQILQKNKKRLYKNTKSRLDQLLLRFLLNRLRVDTMRLLFLEKKIYPVRLLNFFQTFPPCAFIPSRKVSSLPLKETTRQHICFIQYKRSSNLTISTDCIFNNEIKRRNVEFITYTYCQFLSMVTYLSLPVVLLLNKF